VDEDALQERLAVWRRAGVLTAADVDRIRAFEAGTTAPPPPPGPADADRRGRLAEVVGYVGAAFTLGAIGLLLAETWPDLSVWARVALAGLLTLTALAAGGLLRGRRGPAVGRLVGVLWTVGVVGVAWTAGIVAADVLAVPLRWMVPTVAGSAAVVAAVLLAVGRHVPVQLATFVALGGAVAGTLFALAPLEPGALAVGTLVTGGSAAWGLAGAGGWLGPRRSAETVGAAFLLIGTLVLTGTGWPRSALALGVLLALVVVGLSVPGSRIHLLYVGAVGLFVTVPQLVFALFSDTLGAPATLLTVGLLLILMAVAVGRLRRAQEAPHG